VAETVALGAPSASTTVARSLGSADRVSQVEPGCARCFPTTREQRCRLRKIGNVLSALPAPPTRAPSGRWPRSAMLRTVTMPAVPWPRSSRPGSKVARQAMAYMPIEAAQHRWRAVNAPHLVALVRVGARFERGRLVERQPRQVAA